MFYPIAKINKLPDIHQEFQLGVEVSHLDRLETS